MTKNKIILIVIGVVATAVIALFALNMISGSINESAVNKQLDSLTASANKHLGNSYQADTSERKITCWTAEQPPFSTGNKWCGGKLTISSTGEGNYEQVKEAYKSIYNDLVAGGWVQFSSYPKNTTPNDNPAMYYVDLEYRNDIVCNSRINNYNQYSQEPTYNLFSIEMGCSWRAQ